VNTHLLVRSERGMTLIESSVILAVIAVLTAILAPEVQGYIDRARIVRTREDVQTIGTAIQSFFTDTGETQFLIDGSNGAGNQTPPTRADAQRVNLLVSDGDIPLLATAVATSSLWTQTVNSGGTVDTLANHLVENARMTSGVEPKDTNKRYRNPTDISVGGGGNNIDFARAESGGFNALYAWRGPYLRGPVEADPWGNRYAVNTVFLDPDAASGTIGGVPGAFANTDYPRLDVFVVSAGPDEEIDSSVAQDGAVPGDDDFIYIVSSNAK
jgi:type II secretory pathway pseudopilin PulG